MRKRNLLFIFALISCGAIAEQAKLPQWGFTKDIFGAKKAANVLLIGDSVMKGYCPIVAAGISDFANCDIWSTPSHLATPSLCNELEKILSENKYDVIHFNIGLHGWVEGRIPDGQYEPLLRKYVDTIQANSGNAKLIWASTTPIMTAETPRRIDVKNNAIIIGRNIIARRLMAEKGIKVNNLYSALCGDPSLGVDKFHWSAEGRQQAADFVLKEIKVAMGIKYIAKVEEVKPKEFVRGGQFKDLILPMPIINGLETEGIWGDENVIPRDKDNGMEDNEWCYWGGNPILGKDGKYHIAVCRWPESTGHHGWFHSEVAHCVSDNPIGPYVITGTIVKEGHNPEVIKLPDGTFALHVLNHNSVYTADKMEGPWTRMGSMKLDARGFKANNNFGSNLTTEYRPDGSIILMKKDGDITISQNGILGPYKMVSTNNYTRSTGYPEDPVIWRSRHQYHAIYNHAQDRKSGYMRSLDGVHWKNEGGLPYDASTTFYTDGTKNTWYKFERPKILQDSIGRASHLSLAVMDVAKGADKGNDIHSSKNMIMPLVKEKLITILNPEPITEKTFVIALLIEAEDGFNPQKDIDIQSLRFGSDSLVNYGGGCKATGSEYKDDDLIVYFEGEKGINCHDFDLKLLGKTKSGELVFGYALLPGRSINDPSLIVLPFKFKDNDGKMFLLTAVENCGLSESKACKVEVRQYSKAGKTVVATVDVPAIKPYGKKDIFVSLGECDPSQYEYDLVILGDDYYDELWQKVDDTDDSVLFTGNWAKRDQDNKECFLNNEMVSTTIGDSVEFTFTGTKAKAYGVLGRKVGSFDVYIDGEFVEKVRCGWAPTVQSPIYQTGLLSEGKHVLKMVKSESEYMGEVSIDAFAYEALVD